MKHLIALLALTLCVTTLYARQWSANGKTVEAELVAYDPVSNSVWLLPDGREKSSKVSLSILDYESKKYVQRIRADLIEYKGKLYTAEAKLRAEIEEWRQTRDEIVTKKLEGNIRLIVFDSEKLGKVGEPEHVTIFADSEKRIGLKAPPNDLMRLECLTEYSFVLKFPKRYSGNEYSPPLFKNSGRIKFIFRKQDEERLFKNTETKGCGYVVFTGEEDLSAILVCPDKDLATTLSRIIVGTQEEIAKLKEIKEREERRISISQAKTEEMGTIPAAENAQYKFNASRVLKKHDDFEDCDVYYTLTPPTVSTLFGEANVEMFIWRDNKGSNVGIMASYEGKDWIFVHDVTFLGKNGTKFSFIVKSPQRDVRMGKVSEQAGAPLSKNDIDILEKIFTSGKVRVRFDYSDSNGQRVDWTMRGYQIQACLDIINTYKNLR